LLLELPVAGEGSQESGGQGSIDLFKKFEEDQADGIALPRQTVTAGTGALFYQPFGTELGKVVSKRAQAVFFGGDFESCQGIGIDLGGGKSILRGDMGEADQRVHEGQLTWVIQF